VNSLDLGGMLEPFPGEVIDGAIAGGAVTQVS
jgi:hypothetical protein